MSQDLTDKDKNEGGAMNATTRSGSNQFVGSA